MLGGGVVGYRGADFCYVSVYCCSNSCRGGDGDGDGDGSGSGSGEGEGGKEGGKGRTMWEGGGRGMTVREEYGVAVFDDE